MLGEKNEAIKKATSILEVMSHDEDTRRAYEAREAALHDEVTKIQEARAEEKLQNAKNFLLMGASIEMVAGGTGLGIDL